MQTVTSREVQNKYGDFVEAVQDDLVCVTRHGRPLYWAVSDRHVIADNPAVLIGRLLLLNGQMNRSATKNAGEVFTQFLEQHVDPSIQLGELSLDDVAGAVDGR